MVSKLDNIDEIILQSAKEEFFAVGFEKASLRTICKKANVTTGAFYRRYQSKDDLFERLIQPFMESMSKMCNQAETRNQNAYQTDTIQIVWNESEQTYRSWVSSFYESYDATKLILCCANGSRYENYLNDFIEQNTKSTIDFVRMINEEEEIDEEELHILLTAFWRCVFEPVCHDFPLDKALNFCETINTLFNWKEIFKIKRIN